MATGPGGRPGQHAHVSVEEEFRVAFAPAPILNRLPGVNTAWVRPPIQGCVTHRSVQVCLKH